MGWGCDCECALYLQKGTGMEYREDRKGQRLSILGYGCMRFTKNGSAVDLDKAEQELMYAIRHGVNYLDTAYVYAGNEEAVGTILERNHCRRDIFLATKLPHYLIKSKAGAQKKFEEELRRLRTDYIDFYLMHMLNDVKTWESLVRIGIADWIAEKKVSGEIRSIGFSYHGNSENFRALLDAYDWDFCQIQYNYLDEHSQAGREGLEYAAKKGIPVIIMEPLRGGRLVQHLPQTAKEQIASSGLFQTPAEMALKWLWDQPGVTCVLCCAAGPTTPGCGRPSGRPSGPNPGSIILRTGACPRHAACTASEDNILWVKFWPSAQAPGAAPSRPRCPAPCSPRNGASWATPTAAIGTARSVC